MTVDEAIEKLTEFRRIYGGDSKVVLPQDGEDHLEIIEITPVGSAYGSMAGILCKEFPVLDSGLLHLHS